MRIAIIILCAASVRTLVDGSSLKMAPDGSVSVFEDEFDTRFKNLDVDDSTTLGSNSSDELTMNAQILGGSPFILEGATKDDFEVTIAVADPGADATVTIPAETGTILTSVSTGSSALTGVGTLVSLAVTNNITLEAAVSSIEHTGATSFTISSSGTDGSVTVESMNVKAGVVTGLTSLTTDNLSVNGNMALGSNSSDELTMNAQILGGSPFILEGATKDDFEVTIAVADPGADATVTIPAETGTILTSVSTGSSALTGVGTLVSLAVTNNITLEAAVSSIEHTGATSFTISSSGTDGSVTVESMNVKAGVVTGLTSLTTDDLSANGNIVIGSDAADTLNIQATLSGAVPLVFEGANADDFEITIAIEEPSSDYTLTLPAETGTILTSVSSRSITSSHANGGLLLTSESAQVITHTGTAADNKDLSISSQNGAVNVEDVKFTGASLTASSAISMASTGSTVSIEGVLFTDDAIDQSSGNGALTIEGVVLEDGTIGLAGNFELTSELAQTITHTGTAADNKDLSILSQNGAVNVEDVKFTGASLTASSAISMASTGSTVSIEGALFTDDAVDQSSGNGALTIEGVSLEDGSISAAHLGVTGETSVARMKYSKTEVNPATSIALDMSTASSYIEVTSNTGTTTANEMSISNAAEGHILIIKNLDDDAVTVNSGGDQVSIASKTGAMLIFDGAVWEALSFTAISGNRRLSSPVKSGRTYSDHRVKESIETISNALEKLRQIRGVSFEYKVPPSIRERKSSSGHLPKNGHRSIGVVAQEIELVLPELVFTDELGLKTVEYGNLAGFLIQVNKEQEIEIKRMQDIIKTMSSEIEDIRDNNEEIRLIIVVSTIAIFSVVIFALVFIYWMMAPIRPASSLRERIPEKTQLR